MSDSSVPPVSLMLIDQRKRWQRGDFVPVEKLVDEQPSLREQAESVLELLYHEMLLSEERGQPPQLEDYLRRFPHFADEVRMQFEVHAALTAAGDHPAGNQVDGDLAKAFDSSPRCPEIEGYELLGELGRGGMGVVYKARQVKLNRVVALKMIRLGLLAGTQELARFRREAEVVAQLQHPNIVQIHEVGDAKGWPYLALEFVDGQSLDRVIAGKPQPLEWSARLMEDLARTMHYAHLRGVVHRDLKPANILLAAANSDSRLMIPKITDFGLAKSLQPSGESPTHTGDILGTPNYMAPEQAAGKPDDVGFAADIYSLGAVLYEMLTGRPPFAADTIVETLLMVRTQEPASPSRLRPNLPRDLVTICLTCLQKQPGRRYATAQDLADDLRHFLNHEPIRARPTGVVERTAKWTRRHPAAAALIATVILVAISGFTFVSWQLGKTAAALADAKRANAESQAQNYLNLVALAHHELLAHHVGQAEHLLDECPTNRRGWEWHYLKRMCQTDLFSMAGHTSEARTLAYSSDGDLVASGSGDWAAGDDKGELKVWDARTGKELHTLLRNEKTIFSVAFSPDSRLLASAGREGKIILWDPRSGKSVRQFKAPNGIFHLAFSPDGRRLVSGGWDLRIWDVETGKTVHVLKKHTSAIFSVAWSPNGKLLISTDRNGQAHLWNPDTGEHVRLLAHVSDLRASAFSPDSAQFAAGSWNGTIHIWDMKNLDAPPTVRHPNAGQIYDLAYSPEGRRLAFCGRDGVKIWDLRTGMALHDYSGHNGVAASLAFSPDGTRLATGGVDGTVKIWDATVREEFRRYLEANAQTSGSTYGSGGELLALGHVDGVVKIWDTATAKTILAMPKQALPITAVASDRGGRWLAWIGSGPALQAWDRESGKMAWSVPIDHGPVTGLAFSADGTRLAWGGADGVVRVCQADTGLQVAWLGGSQSPISGVAFHPLQNELATVDRTGTFRIWDVEARKKTAEFGGFSRHATVDGSPDESIPGSAAPRITRLAYSPDGKRLASATRLRPPEIWDISTGKLALILDRAVDGADWAAFSDDGQQFVAGLGSQLRFWNTAEQPRPERLKAATDAALVWHKREGVAARNERNWFAREFHLRHIIAAEPHVAAHREGYASALGYLGRWEETVAETAKAIELDARHRDAWYNRACLALRIDDREEYRLACMGAHEKIALTDDPNVANFLAWISVIGPEAGGDPQRYVELAELALQKRPGYYAYLNTHGAALYRAGRFDEAIKQLQRAIEVQERTQSMGTDWAFLAMACAKLNQPDNAKSWLEKSLSAPDPTVWQELIEQQSLQKEASTVVNLNAD